MSLEDKAVLLCVDLVVYLRALRQIKIYLKRLHSIIMLKAVGKEQEITRKLPWNVSCSSHTIK
jgi:hypothetical protein